MNQTSPATANPSCVTHKSLALTALADQLQTDRSYVILDLGPPLSMNLQFWSQFQPKIFIADFYRGLNAGLSSNPDLPHERLYEALLPDGLQPSCDIILAWDLFNYLEREPLEALIGCLSRLCRPGTFLFALMGFTQQMPADPQTFRIVDRDQLSYENRSNAVRPCPRYQPRDINKMMEGFRVFNSFILRHGFQEYLFVRD